MIRLASSFSPRTAISALQDFAAHRLHAGFAPTPLLPDLLAATEQLPPMAPTSPAYAPLEGRLLDIAIDDWNELFRAVEARLKATVGLPRALASDAKPDEMGLKVQSVVLECVAALEQLHTALSHERGMRHQLEMEVFDAQTALARALAENMGAKAAKAQPREGPLPAQPSTPVAGEKVGIVPSSHGFAATLLAYKASGGTLRGDDLSRLLEQRQKGEHVSLAKLMASREIFGFEWNYNCWVPMFQFDPGDLSVRQGPKQVLAELARVRQGWGLAVWFVQTNPFLNGRLPVDLMQSDLPGVLAAARCAQPLEMG